MAPRADAVRNRERVLAAARAAFADLGGDAPMEEVARRAEVGMGTIYRHFPDKEALLVAVLDQRSQVSLAWVDEALEHPDPWEGFALLFGRLAQEFAEDRSLVEVARLRRRTDEAESYRQLVAGTQRVIDRAQRAGVLRLGIDADDVPALLAVAWEPPWVEDEQERWSTYVEVLLDGLRRPGPGG